MAIQSFPFALSVGSSIYSCTNVAAPAAAAAALDGRSTFLGFQDCLPKLWQESGGFRSVTSASSSGISQKQGRKHGSCNPGTMSFCEESMTQSCFTCGSLFVSKIGVYPQQQRQNVRPTIITTRTKCLSSSVEVDQEIVDDGSTSERVSEEPLTNSVSVKKTLRPLRLAPKPPMRKISVESPIKDEKILDSSSEAALKMESARVTSPSETFTPFQSPEALPKESRRGKIGRRSQMDEFLELRSELKDDQASKDLISLISYIRFVLHVKLIGILNFKLGAFLLLEMMAHSSIFLLENVYCSLGNKRLGWALREGC
ncbi:hypothetical protein O6H91_20G066300 [Diphasiastrum complanatum]|uniref:Uncharacterized protein n=1 Tax=Diphasiastrum complanatum TaxID=34168 RepID=A0ACC2ARE2_DIPCM|nr:hypothetical protein O6H91_20G066300 [Diphasiastrum complanatum]